MAVAVAVMTKVEPCPDPAFAVMGRGEQPIDEPFVGIGVWVFHKLPHLVRRRRQADQIERHAADERGAIGLGGGSEPCSFETREDEAIDRIPRPLGMLRRWEGWPDDRLERPMLLSDRQLV